MTTQELIQETLINLQQLSKVTETFDIGATIHSAMDALLSLEKELESELLSMTTYELIEASCAGHRRKSSSIRQLDVEIVA